MTLLARMDSHGKLKLEGESIRQGWEIKQAGGIFNSPGAVFLEKMKNRTLHLDAPLTCTDAYIIKVAKSENISIAYLRGCISVDWSLRREGRKIVERIKSNNASEEMVRQDLKREKITRITPDFLRHFQSRLKNGELRENVCKEVGWSLEAMRHYFLFSGELTKKGECILIAEKNEKAGMEKNPVTPAAIMVLQERVANKTVSDENVLQFAMDINVSSRSLHNYLSKDGEFTLRGKEFLERHRPAVPAHATAVAQVREAAKQIPKLLDQGEGAKAREEAQKLLQPQLLTQLNSPWKAGRTEMGGQEAADMNAANAGYMDLLKILVSKELLDAQKVLNQVFGAGAPKGGEAPFGIHIASRIPEGGLGAEQLAESVTQLLRALVSALAQTEGEAGAAYLVRKLLLEAYPHQTGVPDKEHYKKYQDFIGRAVLGGGMTYPRRSSLIAARGLSDAGLLPRPGEGTGEGAVSRKRARKFEEVAKAGHALSSKDLPRTGTEFVHVDEDLGRLDLEGKYTARLEKRARMDVETKLRRAEEEREKAILSDIRVAVNDRVNRQWEPLARQTRKSHTSSGGFFILDPVTASAHAAAAASVPLAAPQQLVDDVLKALMGAPQGKAVMKALLETWGRFALENHPELLDDLKSLTATKADATQRDYEQRVGQMAAWVIQSSAARDQAEQARRAAQRAEGEQQQTWKVQAQSGYEVSNAGAPAGSTGAAGTRKPIPPAGNSTWSAPPPADLISTPVRHAASVQAPPPPPAPPDLYSTNQTYWSEISFD